MHLAHVLVRGGFVTVLASSTMACNTLLGVEDVFPLDCHINSDFKKIASDTTTTSLTRVPNGSLTAPELDFQLTSQQELVVGLYDNTGQHGTLTQPGTYPLLADDARDETCGICVALYVDFDTGASTNSVTYQAFGQGDLQLSTADSTRLAGSIHNLRLRHVTTTDTSTTEINDGCTVTIEDVEFDMLYSPAALP